VAIKRLNENPTISDDVIIDILIPDATGGFDADPYRVDEVVIYYVQRDFINGNNNQNETNQFFFREAQVVKKFGTVDMPAWLSSDPNNAFLEHITTDKNGDTQYGHFQLNWQPIGMREGDYFVSWTWTALPASEKVSSNLHFALEGSTQLTTSIPTHYTRENKYEILQERYTPEMFKMMMSANDLSPLVIQELNKSIAKGFTSLENMANQMVDLVDANATHESLLQLLGNTFGLKLRSGDPTLWRRQIKNAIPLFKKKGTLNGLSEALSQAGINLKKYTRLWQVISPYTVQEAFDFTDSNEFELSKTALPGDDNFELYLRTESGDWNQVSDAMGTIVTVDGVSTLTWNGVLTPNSSIRVIYLVKPIPSDQQAIEFYIRKLPLADQRDERNQKYPKKNWNVRVIEEDDPLLDTIVPTRHPYHDPLIYGKLRTEFAYSENIYNMEEYNGSTRDSYQPCDIDKDFLDPCSQGLSSKYNVDLEIDNISNDRIKEATEILNEFTPFHAILHSINLTGNISEFVKPPEEEVTALVQFTGEEIALSDRPQTIFNRAMTKSSQLRRNMLASMTVEAANQSASAKNREIVLFSPEVNLGDIAVANNTNLTYLEVLSPSPNAGTYKISSSLGNYAVLNGSVNQPLNESAFSFRLSNEILRKNTSAAVEQIRTYYLKDVTADLNKYDQIVTQTDIDNGNAGDVWYVTIGNVEHDILEMMSDGSFRIAAETGLPTATTSGVDYIVHNGSGAVIADGTGTVKVNNTGRIALDGTILVRGSATTNITNIRSLIKTGNYILIDGTQYKVIGFDPDETNVVYIDKYTGGNASGISVIAYQRVADNAIGYFHYRGLELETASNLDIENVDEYLILIGTDYYSIADISGSTVTLEGPHKNWRTTGTSVTFNLLRYEKTAFSIPERSTMECRSIDRVHTINPDVKGSWQIFNNGNFEPQFSGTGTAGQAYEAYNELRVIMKDHFDVKLTGEFCPSEPIVTTPAHFFEAGVDRSGEEIIEVSSGDVSAQMASKYLNVSGKDQVVDSISHSERISFKIERRQE